MNETDEDDVPEGLPPFVEVPYSQLSQAALRGVVLEFITREGTDYGEYASDIEEKIASVMGLLTSGEALIVYSLKDRTTTLITRKEFEKINHSAL
jgi:hypothetical protein